MGCVYSEEVVQQHSPSSSTSSLEMIELIETKEIIYKNNIKKLFKEENKKIIDMIYNENGRQI
jgi:hypothetical protein